MTKKLELLKTLNKLGVGYCSQEDCKNDEMGVGVSFEDILKIDISLLANFLEE